MNLQTQAHEFTAFFPFCGLGAGARGFLQAMGRLGEHGARFRNLGGIDNDAAGCQDFEYLTGAPAMCADINEVTPEQLLAFAGERRPDCVFLSPPCKGFSQLLSKDLAASDKYQKLNRLVLQGLFLMVETWKKDPPPTILVENVPGIQKRGALLLEQVRSLLKRYGYVFHEGTHDCGEIGGLAQHRRRFLMVARRPKAVPAFIYRPPRLRVKGCGEVLESLPMPADPAAGKLHELPKLSWLNWVRLALIPAGGDWRDLPASIPEVLLAQTARGAASFKGRPGLMGVNDWNEPIPTVIGTASVSGSNGTAAVADPRVPRELRNPLKPGQARRGVFCRWHVNGWRDPARTVAGPGMNGGYGVADPRPIIALQHTPHRGTFGVTPWTEPAPTVRGNSSVRQAESAVADPRVQATLALPPSEGRHEAKYRVTPWSEPTGTVTGARPVTSGGPAVADPRLAAALGTNRRANRYTNQYRVRSWAEPAGAITGDTDVQEGAQNIADPRPGGYWRNGQYGVIGWHEAAATVTGNASCDNGAFAVADPRKAPENAPVIVAEDGTWHRPLTTLELAALQGLPAMVNGAPLKLAGTKGSAWRERIGNAVPVQAGRAIAESILTALLAAKLGTWALSMDAVWVRRDGLDENTANAPWMREDLARERARVKREKFQRPRLHAAVA